MKIPFLVVILSCCSLFASGKISNQNIAYIEIYYTNPDFESYSGTTKKQVIQSANDFYRSKREETKELGYYTQIKERSKCDSIINLFNSLSVCRQKKENDKIDRDIRVVIAIKYKSVKDREYILLSSTETQSIIFENTVYESNLNFYRYVMSLWPIQIDYHVAIENKKCS